jgi:hypothetical protein
LFGPKAMLIAKHAGTNSEKVCSDICVTFVVANRP